MNTVLLVPSVIEANVMLPLCPNADWRYFADSELGVVLPPVRVPPAHRVVPLREDERAELPARERVGIWNVTAVSLGHWNSAELRRGDRAVGDAAPRPDWRAMPSEPRRS